MNYLIESNNCITSVSNIQENNETEFVSRFDHKLKEFSFWKGRVALFAILKALGITEGDEVILPGYTCVVVPNAIRFTGAVPVYVDNAYETYHLDPRLVDKSINSRTKAIIIQHTYGIPGPLEDIAEISKKNGIPFIEDCAHSFFSSLNNKILGSWGSASFFSTQWSKPYTTGLGGIAVANDDELQKKLELFYESTSNPPLIERAKLSVEYSLYEHFFSPKIYWQAQDILHFLSSSGLFVGSSSDSELNGVMPADHYWRMGNGQKKAGSAKLKSIQRNLDNRKLLTEYYDIRLKEKKWQPAYRNGETVFLRYPIRVANKTDLLEKAKRAHIELGSWFETPLHPIPLSQHEMFGYHLGQCLNAERDAGRVINLPLHEHVRQEDAEKIISFVFENAIPIN